MANDPMNVNTNTNVRRKRKRTPNSNNNNNTRGPTKRTDLSMSVEFRSLNNNKITITLPRRVIKDLENLNKTSSRERWEYGGKINVKAGIGANIVKFNAPNRLTGEERGTVSEEIAILMSDSYISYHTHPAAYPLRNTIGNQSNMNINRANNVRTIFATLPSDDDIRFYRGHYPRMQANIIADEHGYYVIDLIETRGRPLPDAEDMVSAMEWFRAQPFITERLRDVRGYEYFETTVSEWKDVIKALHKRMLELYGLSIRYYGYNGDPGEITLTRL